MIRFFFAAILAAATAGAAVSERGQLDGSPTLFTVMAAINAAGYDADLASASNSPLRDMVRKEVADKHLASVEELKKFFAAHRQESPTAELSQYISFALTTKGAPDFAITGRDVDIPPDVIPLTGLSPLLAQFYKEAKIEDLWQRSQPYYESYIASYHGGVSKAILTVNAYLRNVTSGYLGRRFQVYIELLGAPNQIQARSYGDDYYVVLTPSPSPQISDVRHGYFHYLLDPLSTKYSEILMRKRSLSDFIQGAQALPEAYKQDFLLLATESLIKALEARLDKSPAHAAEALSEGFILTPYFSEQLPLYEVQEQSLRIYYPDMVKAIDLQREVSRLQNVQFAKEARVRQAKPAPEPPKPPELTGARKTLEEAEQLYTARNLDVAKQTFLSALQQTDEKPLHAQAYYGMARIALLQKNPELAERLFQRAIELSPEPPVKAWCYVYLGRLADAAGEREQATKHYQTALSVQGASDAARQAAEQGTKKSFQK